MNKSLLMAMTACAAMAMTSCSSEDLTSGTTQANETPISFSTYLGRAAESRATGVTTDNLTEIGVYAAYTGTSDWANTNSLDFMMNQKVTKGTTDSKWTYTPLKYWPANETEKISFFAYAPYDGDNDNMTLTANSTTTTTATAPKGAPVATFSITDADIAKTPDFVAACVMNKEKPADNTVKFTLKHAMTRVAMKAKVSEEVYASSGDANKTKVVITGVKLTSDGELTTNAEYTFPNSTDNNGKWSATGTTHSFALSSILKNEASGIIGNDDKGAVLTGTTPASILNSDYLYLIPANEGEGLSAAGTVKAEISYSIVTEDDNLANGSVTTKTTKEVKLPAAALAQGESYTFTFTIGVNAIILDVNSVNSWGTETSKDLDV